jgi:hypothetical protein
LLHLQVSQPLPAIPPSSTIERRQRVGTWIGSIPSTHGFLPFLLTFAFAKETAHACAIDFVWCKKESLLKICQQVGFYIKRSVLVNNTLVEVIPNANILLLNT